MAKYQYKLVQVERRGGETFAQSAERALNEQGADGWRFTHYKLPDSPENTSHYYYFEREIAD